MTNEALAKALDRVVGVLESLQTQIHFLMLRLPPEDLAKFIDFAREKEGEKKP